MILVTGATGFIGKHLLSALKKAGKNNVLALTSASITDTPYLLHHNYSFEPDFFLENGYDINTIIHAGAFTPKNSSTANDFAKCNQNIYTLEKLLSSNMPNLKQVIFLSSLDVYGEADVITEDTKLDPATLYGASKLYGEKMLAAWSLKSKVNYQILRIGHVYGPGEEQYQKIIPLTIKKLLTNQPIEVWGDGSELRSFIYIDDVVTAIVNSLELTDQLEPINIVSENAISIKDLVSELIRISGKSAGINFLERHTKAKSLKFQNTRMKKYLLKNELDLNIGLQREWDYMNR